MHEAERMSSEVIDGSCGVTACVWQSMEVDGVMVMKFLSKLQKTNALKDAGIEHKAGERPLA
jgi:hypothetical protein